MGGEKLPSDETLRQSRPLPSFPPLFPLNMSPSLMHTPCLHSLSFTSLPSLCYCRSKDGVGSDKVLGLIDGQSWRLDKRMDEGGGGSLTQANTERQRGTTCLAMQLLTAPQQFSSPLTQRQWTLSLATCLGRVHTNERDSKQGSKETRSPQRRRNAIMQVSEAQNKLLANITLDIISTF